MTDLTGEIYRTRERLHDTEDHGGILVAIETVEERADRFELVPDVTVAQIHNGYPPSDRVVKCVYQRQLEKLCPDWREIPKDELVSRLDNYGENPVGMQILPSTRLERYVGGNFTDRGGVFHCENCDSPVDTAADWLEHVARDCPGVNA